MDILPKANWPAVAAFATVLAAAVTATWQIRDKVSEQRIQQCLEENSALTGAKDWRLPETLRSLHEVSDAVALQIKERKELDNLRTEVTGLRATADSFARDASASKKANGDCQASLAKSLPANSVSFELEEGEGRELIPGLLALGLTRSYTGHASITLNGASRDLAVSESSDTGVAGGKCSVVLIGATYLRAKFVFRCSEPIKQ